MRATSETPRGVETSRLALERLFKAEDWQLPLRLCLLAVLTALLVNVGLGSWPVLWALSTGMLEGAGYLWRRRVRAMPWNYARIPRLHLINDLIGHLTVVAWIIGAIGLYLSGLMVGRMAGLLFLAAIGMTVSWQPGRLPYAAWLNAALPSAVMIALTAPEIDSPEGQLRFGAALLFSINVISIAVVTMRSNRAMLAAQAAQEELIGELDSAREAAEAGRRGAEEMAKLKDEFLAVMSHEVRTPLNGVLAMADILSRSELRDEQRRQVESIAESGRMLLGIVSEVLDISRLEAGAMQVRSEPVDLRHLLGDNLLPWRARAEAQGLGFRTHIAEDVPRRIRTDGTRLKQILFNLIGNALKFTRTGEIAVEAVRSAGPDGPMLRITVRDTGDGVPDSDIERIFDRFAQVEDGGRRQKEGTGLGLPICKALVELLGGEIGVDSQAGTGSTFFFTLPCHPVDGAGGAPDRQVGSGMPDAGEGEAETAGAPDSDKETADTPLHVLVVDDNAINRSVIEAMLTPIGARFRMAESGAEAVRAAHEEQFDLILMDIRMPQMDGKEAIRRIREIPQARGIPVITLTAGDDTEEEKSCLEAGANAHLTKPLSAELLYGRIAELTGRDISPHAGARPHSHA